MLTSRVSMDQNHMLERFLDFSRTWRRRLTRANGPPATTGPSGPAGYTTPARGEPPAGTTGRTFPVTSNTSIGHCRFCSARGHSRPEASPAGVSSTRTTATCQEPNGVHQQAVQAQLETSPEEGPVSTEEGRHPSPIRRFNVHRRHSIFPTSALCPFGVVFQHHHEDTPVQERPQPESLRSTLSKPRREPTEVRPRTVPQPEKRPPPSRISRRFPPAGGPLPPEVGS